MFSPLVSQVQKDTVVKEQIDKRPLTNKQHQRRKTRCDKKYDIRIPVSEEEKYWIRLLSKNSGLSMTQWTSQLINNSLLNNSHFQVIPYRDSDNIVHAKVDQETYKDLIHLSAKWNCSIRRAAHRVFKHMLILEVNRL